MLKTKTNSTVVNNATSNVTRPYEKASYKKAPQIVKTTFDVIQFTNNVIFVGLAFLAIYLFYNILLSFMM